MSMAVVAAVGKAVAIGVATNVISSKIMGSPDQRAQIGSGTSPSINPGSTEMEISPVEGSSVTEFENTFENGSAEQGAMNQQMILDQLQQAGVSPDDLDQYGIAGMAVGGYLQEATRMANGGPLYRNLGGITSLLGIPMTMPDMPPNMSTNATGNPINPSDVDFSQMAPVSPEVEMENMMFNSDDINSYQGSERIDLDMGPSQETAMFSEGVEELDFSKLSPSVLERVGDFYQSQDPMVQEAMVNSLKKMGGSAATRLFNLGPEQRGSRVRTQTLPGNSNRRRSGLDYSPIQANEGSALQRPMFMPNGGAMHGPGGFKDDLIPVMASNGEYMLSKAAVDHAGGGSHAMGIANLEKFNKAGNKRYGQ